MGLKTPPAREDPSRPADPLNRFWYRLKGNMGGEAAGRVGAGGPKVMLGLGRSGPPTLLWPFLAILKAEQRFSRSPRITEIEKK